MKKNIVRFRLRLRMEWNVDFWNSTKEKTIFLRGILHVQMVKAFSKIVKIMEVYIVQFNPGSVFFELEAESSSPLSTVDYSDHAVALRSYLDEKQWKLESGSGTVDVLSSPEMLLEDEQDAVKNVTIKSPCSVYDTYNMCNNGSCSYPGDKPVCTCAEGYMGQFCDSLTQPNSNYVALVTGLSVMAAVLLALLVAIFVYCRWVRSPRRRNSRERYEETPSEYSVEGPEDVVYKSSSLKTRLNPKWTSGYTTSMYNYHYDNNARSQSDS
jgi:hypothetical protein